MRPDFASFTVPFHVAGSVLLAAAALAGPADVRPLVAKPGPKPFAYTNAPDALPNYVAGAKWGTQADPIRTMQSPLSPTASAERWVTQPGFQVKLWAAEPEITKPIAMAWDDRGRLWISETVDYPNELRPAGQGRDRIKICEDTDGDGRADRFTIFADELSIPTSLCFANGGLIVFERGQTLFLKDTNGDDKADERRVLFSAWGMSDTHATASNMRYGLDNWIWGTVGYSGFEGVVGGKKLQFGMGVYRFKPDGSALEFIRSSNNNTWGLALSEDGTVFGSTANGNASWFMAMPNRFYEVVDGWSASRMESIADAQDMYPVTDKVRQVDWHHKYTAGAGAAIYTARQFPQEFWNQISFVCEPTGHLVGWFRLEAQGADYKARNLGSFMASDDEWSAPIAAEVGPDGSLWVIDWYNYIIQHNPVPVGFKNGQGNAYETSLRDKRHGRIYRVTSTAGTATAAPKLSGGTPEGWVQALTTENQLWRLQAQRLLVERGQRDVVPALQALVRKKDVDALGLNVGAIHALWTLQGLQAVGSEAVEALRHPSPGVRRAAVSVLPRTEASVQSILSSGIGKDSEPAVRLAAFLALAEMPPSAALAVALADYASDPANAKERWLREGLTSAGARSPEAFLEAFLRRSTTATEGTPDIARVVARHLASRNPQAAASLVNQLPQASAPVGLAVLDGFVAGWPEGRALPLSNDAKAKLRQTLTALPDASRDRFLVLSQKWGCLDMFSEQLAASLARLRAQVADPSLADATRLAAARYLLQLADDPASAQVVMAEISPRANPSFANGLLASLTESRRGATGQELLKIWPQLSPGQRRAALATLLRRTEWSAALLDAVASGAVLRNDLGPEHWQQLKNQSDKALAARAQTLSTAGQGASSDRQEVVQKLAAAAQREGSVAQGKTLFQANCAVCHRLDGVGQSIGPELTGIGVRPRADLLVEILDPNRSVEANYRLWTLSTKGGETFTGRLDGETQTSVELLDLSGLKHTVPRPEIASLESSNQSIMPTGFESLGEDGLAAILAYLATSNAPR